MATRLCSERSECEFESHRWYQIMNDTYRVNKRNQLRCGWRNTPEGRIIKVVVDGEKKCVLVVDDSDEEYFLVRDVEWEDSLMRK